MDENEVMNAAGEIDDGLEVEDSDLDDDIGTVGESDESEETAEEADPFESLYEDEESDETSEDEIPEEEEVQPDAQSEEAELLEAAKQMLKSLGAENVDDPKEVRIAIRRLTAEAMGISYEEFERRETAAKAAQERWEAQAKRDIEAIHEAFPEARKYKSLMELPNKGKFAKLMDNPDTKLTAVEAFAASHPDIVSAHTKLGGRGKSSLADTKTHIKSSVPKSAKDTGVNLSKRELENYREMFPELSDKEIRALYKNANK